MGQAISTAFRKARKLSPLFSVQSVAIHVFGLLKLISPSTFCNLFGAPCDSTLSSLTRLSGLLHLAFFGPLTRNLAQNSKSDSADKRMVQKIAVLALSSFGFAASLFIHAPKPMSDELKQGIFLDTLMASLNSLEWLQFCSKGKIVQRDERIHSAIHPSLQLIPAVIGAALILRPIKSVQLMFREGVQGGDRQKFKAMAASYLGVQVLASINLNRMA